MRKEYVILIALFLFGILPAEAQCAMCRAVLESEEDASMAAGVNDGIVYLMLFPYLFIGGVGYFIYRMYRKNRKENDDAVSNIEQAS
ncbi:MAG: hypothetical protein QNJ16_20910 [Rhodobacter sp.]|nr:hypothetical protein [Rhodobacter sp.]